MIVDKYSYALSCFSAHFWILTRMFKNMKKTKNFEFCFLAELEFSTEIENMISGLNRLKRLRLTCCKRDRSAGINSHGEGKHTGRHGLKDIKRKI